MDITLNKYKQIAQDATAWLLEHIQEDSSLYNAEDLAAYHKMPFVLASFGYQSEASSLLKYMQQRFANKQGNFFTDIDAKIKSRDPFYNHFSYIIDAWLAAAAQKLGQFDFSYALFSLLRKAYHPEAGGFITSKPYGEGNNSIDALTTAALGLVCLYFGDLNKAKRAGNFLIRCLSIQPDIRNGYYLQMDESGKLNTIFPDDKAPFFYIPTKEQGESHFIVGRLMYFLTKLHLATGDVSFLTAAKAYAGFLKSCDQEAMQDQAAPTVMAGFAVLARLTKDPNFARQRDYIAELILQQQNSMLNDIKDETIFSYNRMAECALCFQELLTELMLGSYTK